MVIVLSMALMARTGRERSPLSWVRTLNALIAPDSGEKKKSAIFPTIRPSLGTATGIPRSSDHFLVALFLVSITNSVYVCMYEVMRHALTRRLHVGTSLKSSALAGVSILLVSLNLIITR